ncbi:O-antigen polymerase [Legionella jamestowniensis]|uniref:O-antigen polysaccharide polymerase Wzy n=1 Tax=Legionella jamestowniensis TaxID=455 RepID=A0A0W0UFY9_9GAMM|nr:O-antigen polymerase [Legionella jamestowniensis]KTD06818.1 hypothetical protein Ljam_1013 [Legionella jamestowniensis]SFL82729.1 oligosaccharide repeat unit polymerase [Legionella jamestowniensis DSM 19215]
MKKNIAYSISSIELILGHIFLTLAACVFIFYWLSLSTEVIISAFGCFIFGAILASYRSVVSIFSISTICLLALFFYSMAIPLHHLVYSDYDSEGVSFVTINCVAALLGLVSSYYFVGKPNFFAKQLYKDELVFGFVTVSLGVIALLIAISVSVGFSAYLSAGYAGRALIKREVGPIELGLYYSIVGFLFLAYSWLYDPVRKRRMLGFFLILFLLFFVIGVSYLGIRRPSFFLILSSLSMYFLKVRGRVSKKLILFSLACVFLFGIFASFRQVLSDQGVMAAFSYISGHFNLTWLDLSKSELGAPFRAMLQVKDHWFIDGFQLGKSYMEAFINIIPSSILKFSASLSEQYTKEFFSADYIAIGGNMGFFPVAEGYLNFGTIGVFAEFFLVGSVIKYIENKAIVNPRPINVIWYAIVIPWFFFFLRTDFSSFLKSFVYSILPVFFAYALCYPSFSQRQKSYFSFTIPKRATNSE